MHRNTPHLDQHYEAELRNLASHLAQTGLRAESMVRDAVRALLQRDHALARSVLEKDREVNRLEVETDELCVKLLARRAPVGSDLRLVTCALKAVIDMERIGDLAVNIAKRSLEINGGPGLEPIPEIVQLAEGAAELTTRVMRALQQRDADMARTVRVEDIRLDELNRSTFRRMLEFAKNHPDQFERALAWTSVSRHLERVGDHACNIAEEVVFLVEGKVVKHTVPGENHASND